MWIVVLFDLPTDTPQARHSYTRFRKFLLQDGFSMMQYSVYKRHSASEENARVHCQHIKAVLPPDGEVRMIRLTDKQFAQIEVFYGKKCKEIESPPEQLSLF